MIKIKKLLLFTMLALLLCNSNLSGFNSNDSIKKLNSISLDTSYNSFINQILKNFKANETVDEVNFLQQQIIIRKNEPVKQQNLLVLLCKTYYKAKDYNRSLQVTDSILHTEEVFLPEVEAKLYRLKGQSYFKMQEFAKSLENYQQALSILKKTGDKTQMDDVLAAISSMYFEIDNLPDALRYAMEAEKISVETNDLESRSRILNTIGNINKTLGNYADAKKNYLDAFNVAIKTGDKEGMILTTSSMAMIEMHLKNFEEAWTLQQKAMHYAEELNSRHYIGGMYMNMARIRWDEENKEEAIKYYAKGISIAEEIGDRQNFALGNANLGFLYTEEKQYAKSNDYLKSALNTATETGDIDLLREIYGGLYDNNKALNQPKEALHYHELYKNYADSVLNDEKSRELSNLKTQFAVQEKEKELTLRAEKEKLITDAEIKRQKLLKYFSIAGAALVLLFASFIFQRYRERHKTSLMLTQKNQAIEKAYNDLKDMQKELVETEKQREAQSIRVHIARDIHDEIGSSLTKITMLSDVMRKKVKQDEIAESLLKITSYSKEVSGSLGEIVWAINPGHDNVTSLISYMKSTAHNLLEDSGVQYQLKFFEKEIQAAVHPEIKRNIFLVMKEAINNALKYSGAKNILIEFGIKGNKFCLLVEDDGKGFEVPDIHPLQNRVEGNGLYNMMQRMEQHRNSIQIISSPGNGCRIIAKGKLILV